jgi:hypothetical protein
VPLRGGIINRLLLKADITAVATSYSLLRPYTTHYASKFVLRLFALRLFVLRLFVLKLFVLSFAGIRDHISQTSSSLSHGISHTEAS